jgi:Ca2+-transporting ATPase
MKAWHTFEIASILETLAASPVGLSSNEAARRLQESGRNELVEARRISPYKIFLSQFKNILILVLLAAVLLSIIIGEVLEAVTILVIVFFATLLGFFQEYKAERAMEALKRMAAPTASVLRDEEEREIAASEIVSGDIIILRVGDKIPADARIFEAYNLKVMEGALTGESVPSDKSTETLVKPDAPLGDRFNMLYMGTTVSYGRGKAVVVATGMDTEFGKIAGMLRDVETEKTPLQESLDKLGTVLVKAAFAVIAIIVFFGILRGEKLFDMFLWGIALAVAVVPEALPAVVTISLAIGVQKMVRRNALVRKLLAVETLGCTSVICSDKTGTLTRDEMSVRKVYVDKKLIDAIGVGYEPKGEFRCHGEPFDIDDGHFKTLLQIGVLCNDSELKFSQGVWGIKGDPTEVSLLVAAVKGGVDYKKERMTYPRVDEIPFSSERKRMTTLHKTSKGTYACSKGAPEIILESCSHIFTNNKIMPLPPKEKEEILQAAHGMAQDALRVLAFAYKPQEKNPERGMIFVGLVGIIDPPRVETKEAISICRKAGIKPMMITGDHKITALSVAREIGMLQKGLVFSGEEIDNMGEKEFSKVVEDVDVLARVSPVHKIMAVRALQSKGYVVAMTGDGVNDAPALKKADIGMAMGITGTDVTKEAADLILLDDNFATIVAAVEEGRAIFGNIKKYLMYLLSSNLGEILIMAIAVLLGLPLPLAAIQILYVNLATDGLPALALAFDPSEPGLMEKPPRDPRMGIFTRPVVILMLAGGIWSTIVNLSIFLWGLEVRNNMLEAQSMVFVTLILIEFCKSFNFRSDVLSIREYGLFTNRWLVAAIAVNCVMLWLVIYNPALQNAFNTFSLTLKDWAFSLLTALTIFPVLETVKFFIRRSQKSRNQNPIIL